MLKHTAVAVTLGLSMVAPLVAKEPIAPAPTASVSVTQPTAVSGQKTAKNAAKHRKNRKRHQKRHHRHGKKSGGQS
jgi:hypothetical protein